jgi:hypothetical protein
MRPLNSPATGNEVHDDRDYGEQKKQMDEQARGLEHDQTAEPHHHQNDCEYKKHGQSCFLPAKVFAQQPRGLHFIERARSVGALLGARINALLATK